MNRSNDNQQAEAKSVEIVNDEIEEELSFIDHLKIAGQILLVGAAIVAATIIVFWLVL